MKSKQTNKPNFFNIDIVIMLENMLCFLEIEIESYGLRTVAMNFRTVRHGRLSTKITVWQTPTFNTYGPK